MAKVPLENVRIAAQEVIPSPRELGERYPVSDAVAETVAATRAQVQGILERRDPRLQPRASSSPTPSMPPWP